MTQSILVAVDGSPHSLNGAKEAARIAKAIGAKLEVAYVLPPILLSESVYADTIKKIDEANKAEAEAIFAKAREAIRSADSGLQVDTVMLNGAPAEALSDLVQAERFWGVVIGAKGHSAVSRMLLGSVTDRLVHISHKPVLVVR
ncbi:MAG: universal stress protein [Archangium sp.]|nr:universal stress protein [Archangium sp.]